MSIFSPDLVIQIAESLGITLKEEVAKVLVQDAEYRTREIIHESAKFMKHSHRNKLLPSDINSALVVKNIQPLYGYSKQKQFKHINDLYYYEDEELDLEEIINEPLPPVPLDQTFTAHWLAIEGVQPRIVQNPTDQTQKRVVNVKKEKKEEEKVKISQVLTKELELYYDKITTCILAETKYKQLALDSIRNDPGIQSLLPYFVQFIYNTVLENFKSPTMNVLKSMALMMEALLGNVYLFMEPYLHQLLATLVSIIVFNDTLDDHLWLRRYANKVLKSVIDSIGLTYQGTRARVTKSILVPLFDSKRSVSSMYGALYSLKSMGPEVVGLLIIPHVQAFTERLDETEEGIAADLLLKECCEMHFEDQGKTKDLLKLYGKYKKEIASTL